MEIMRRQHHCIMVPGILDQTAQLTQDWCTT
uniref:Uncharacterized protein n=1 Tax=Rhizophora mucronata TaxID=61149 RepID=A0A2P2PZM0_RHIMU